MGNIQLSELSKAFDSQAKIASTMKRLQRFFRLQDLGIEKVSAMIFSLIPTPPKLFLTLDRTNWQFGTKYINFLTLAFVYEGISIPFLWTLIDHKGGSHTLQRFDLIEKALKILAGRKIYCLLADREFIGKEWFCFLKQNKIPFCIRILETTEIRHRNGGKMPVKNFCRHLKGGGKLSLNTSLWCNKVRLLCLRLTDGKLLILATSLALEEDNLFLYKKRWTIECLFKSLKTQGFNIEKTHLKDPERLSKLMAVCAIAFAWSVKMGALKNQLTPIKIKNHGRPLYSLFTYGFQTLQAIFFKAKITTQIIKFFQNFFLFHPPSLSQIHSTVLY
jgi:hypothetical protein